jgi:hypothetical protein
MSNDIYNKLKADFPQEALKADISRGRGNPFTSVSAQYIVERLNEVLGIDGWSFTGDFEKTEEGVLFFGALGIRMSTVTPSAVMADGPGEGRWHVVEGVGFSAHKRNVGDCFKSARTDALSKAASLLGIANEVFKGNVPPPGSSKPAAQPAPAQRAGGKAKPGGMF